MYAVIPDMNISGIKKPLKEIVVNIILFLLCSVEDDYFTGICYSFLWSLDVYEMVDYNFHT